MGWSLPPVVIDDICVQHFVLLYVFLFVVPCCGVRYDFRIKTLFVHRCVKHVLTIRVTRRVSYKRQELLTNCEHLSSPLFLVGFVLLIFLVFCVVFYLSSLCVLSTQCCQYIWIVHSWLPLPFSLPFIMLLVFFYAYLIHTCVQYNFHIISYDPVA